MYKVLVDFKDLRDSGHEYHAGDIFPRTGITVDDKRIVQLTAPTSMRGPLITEAPDEPEKAKKAKKG